MKNGKGKLIVVHQIQNCKKGGFYYTYQSIIPIRILSHDYKRKEVRFKKKVFVIRKPVVEIKWFSHYGSSGKIWVEGTYPVCKRSEWVRKYLTLKKQHEKEKSLCPSYY